MENGLGRENHRDGVNRVVEIVVDDIDVARYRNFEAFAEESRPFEGVSDPHVVECGERYRRELIDREASREGRVLVRNIIHFETF